MQSPTIVTLSLLALLASCTVTEASKPNDALCPSINGACFPSCTDTSQCASGLSCDNGVCMGPAM